MSALPADIKKWKEAISLYDSHNYSGCIDILRTLGENSRIFYSVGMCYFNLEDYKSSLNYFKSAIDCDGYLSVAHLMKGVCELSIGDTQTAKSDFSSSLEALRDHEFIDYTQLKLPYQLYLSDVLFNLALSMVISGEDASEVLERANACELFHTETQEDFNAGLQKMYSGYATGVRPMIADPTKIFQPPISNTATVVKKESKPKLLSAILSLASPTSGTEAPNSPLSAPTSPRHKSPLPSPRTVSGSAAPTPTQPRSAPISRARATSTPEAHSHLDSSVPSTIRHGAQARSLPYPIKNTQPAPVLQSSGKQLPNAQMRTVAVVPKINTEMLRIKVYYKDKRLVEVRKDSPDFFDLKSRIETKFSTPDLIIKYLRDGLMLYINGQEDLDIALAGGLSELYVNQAEEINTFEPVPQTRTAASRSLSTPGSSSWIKCYTDQGELYYFNTKTEESTWDPPIEFTASKKTDPAVKKVEPIVKRTEPVVKKAEPVMVMKREGALRKPAASVPTKEELEQSQYVLMPVSATPAPVVDVRKYQNALSERDAEIERLRNEVKMLANQKKETVVVVPKQTKPDKDDWIECWTDDGEKYYYNTETDESSWDPPK